MDIELRIAVDWMDTTSTDIEYGTICRRGKQASTLGIIQALLLCVVLMTVWYIRALVLYPTLAIQEP